MTNPRSFLTPAVHGRTSLSSPRPPAARVSHQTRTGTDPTSWGSGRGKPNQNLAPDIRTVQKGALSLDSQENAWGGRFHHTARHLTPVCGHVLHFLKASSSTECPLPVPTQTALSCPEPGSTLQESSCWLRFCYSLQLWLTSSPHSSDGSLLQHIGYLVPSQGALP